MPTLKKRTNISVPKTIEQAVVRLAERDQVPQATKATELLRLAVEIEEDEVLDRIASERDAKKKAFVPAHRAWR